MDQEQQHIPAKKDSFFKELLNFALLVIVVILPIRLFVAQPFVVVGSSMEPTFENNEYLIIDELSYRFNAPERGDVVVFEFDEHPSSAEKSKGREGKYFIKRLIGLPGETVVIKNDSVSIVNKEHPQGFLLDEPYLKSQPENNTSVTLGENEHFVMGDNRNVSYDSRSWGALNKEKIVGKVFLRLLPPQHLGVWPGSYAGDYQNEEK